jgi:CheY-like chemotaxis protein
MEILAYIRQDPRLKRIKVIAVTANALLARDLDDKADITFIKPVSYSQISELSARMLHTFKSTG